MDFVLLAQGLRAVLIKVVASSLRPVVSGVIQIDALGPILSRIYVNDALDQLFHSVPVPFADSVKIAYPLNPKRLSTGGHRTFLLFGCFQRLDDLLCCRQERDEYL